MAAKILASGLAEREFLVGGRFTAADILAAHTLAWARAFKMPLDQGGLDAYADRLLARPVAARAAAREKNG